MKRQAVTPSDCGEASQATGTAITSGSSIRGGRAAPGEDAELWHLIERGGDAVTETPPGRWDVDAYYDPNPDVPGKMYTNRGAYIEDFDCFSPTFFGISPREAQYMDPQQRLLLEVAWEALEQGGWKPTIDAFAGVTTEEQMPVIAKAARDGADVFVVELGTNATVRQNRGTDIDAACGQLAVADEQLNLVRFAANLVLAAFFAGANDKQRRLKREELLQPFVESVRTGIRPPEISKAEQALRSGDKAIHPFHWEIEFPEVFSRENGGFSCIVGNPPFAGKNTILAGTRSLSG